ncbi:unnamed protein product [Kluyveromyces dobzhanskii CBS 2104]|uniref:WGS project CCBQ000000000 data, contig 00016 n=1 Tax=Kluyveromyces dobzhanskii CBS 2104 TaxID=1427455 RepID=A0A0A8KZU4_9SACH|nr:unnamed protein product [Kluyveromyces dobzhanskii CBS 2104]
MELKTDNLKAQLTSFTDKLLKTPQQLKCKFYTGPRTKDSLVEDLKSRFEIVHGCSHHLVKNCTKFQNKIHSLLEHFQRSIEIFGNIYEVQLTGEVERKDFESLSKRFEIIKDKIEADLPIFELNVIAPIQRFHTICGTIQNTIDKRDLASYKADSLRHKLTGLSPQKLRTPGLKYENEKVKLEGRYEKAVKAYEPLNDRLRSELRIFLQLTNSFFQDWFLNHYYITYSFYYNMHTFIGTCAEVRRIVIPSQEETGISDNLSPNSVQILGYIDSANNALVSQFHQEHDAVAGEVAKLGIVDFESFYKTINSTANKMNGNEHDDIPPYPDPYLAHSPQYCKAIADFVPTDEDSENSLSIRKEDVIKVYRKETDVWWYGQSLRTNKIGYFPVQCTTLDNI